MINLDDRLIKEGLPVLKPNAFAILICIASHINSEKVAWPGRKRLEKMCSIGRDAVYEAIQKLEELGYVERFQENIKGRFGKTKYRITTPYISIFMPASRAEFTDEEDEPCTDFPDAVKTVHGNSVSGKSVHLSIKKGGSIKQEGSIKKSGIEGEPGFSDFSTPKDTSLRAGSDPESDKSYGDSRELYDSKEFLEYDHALRKLLQKVDKKLRACILDSDVGREDFLDTFVKWCFDSRKTFTGISGLDKLLESHVGFLKSGGKEILEPDMREFEIKIDKAIQFAISRWLVTDPYGNSYEAFLAMNDMNYRSEADALKTLLTRRKINFEDLRIVMAYTGRWRDGKNIYTPNFKYSWAAYLQSPDSLKQDVEYLKDMESFFQKNKEKSLA